ISKRDWSSDVCSSDLLTAKTAELQEKSVEVRSAVEDDEKSVDDVKTGMSEVDELKKEISDIEADIKALKDAAGLDIPKKDDEERSEERRVGRWSRGRR